MTATRLRAVFSAAVAAGLALACDRSSSRPPDAPAPVPGDSGVALPPGSPAYNAPICSDEQLLRGLDSAHTNAKFDHVLLRQTVMRQTDTGVRIVGSQTAAAIGPACQGVPDVPACARLLASSVASTSLFPTPEPLTARYLVLQAGANVRPIATRAQLLTMLGAIDTPGEARLLAATAGVQPLCGDDSVRPIDGGFQVVTKRPKTQCINQYDGVVVQVVRGQTAITGTVDLTDPSVPCLATGRRPEGFAGPCSRDGDPLLAYLGHMQELEAASVPAFEHLARELADHDAPAALVARARAAARDEVRHAAAFARLRHRHRAAPLALAPVATPAASRPLERLACENAVEGCVRETYGALLARWQAETAADPAVRRLFAAIADDETRHAELAWDVHTWLEGQLDPDARARVAAAREASVTELRAAVAADRPDPALAARCGLPPAEVAELLLARCADALWAA